MGAWVVFYPHIVPLDIRRDSGALGTYHLQNMMYIDQGTEPDAWEEMKTSSKKPGFANKAGIAEWCHVIVEEVENDVG